MKIEIYDKKIKELQEKIHLLETKKKSALKSWTPKEYANDALEDKIDNHYDDYDPYEDEDYCSKQNLTGQH